MLFQNNNLNTYKPRLMQLDSLRFFAIAVIILSHFEFVKDSIIGDFYWLHLHNATWGVDYFFMLSGFGLFYSLYDKDIKCGVASNIRFSISKIKKIYPSYIFSVIISLPWIFLFTEYKVSTLIVKFLIDLSLCQSAFGTMALSHSINGVCWFLSTLFICYIFSPFLVKIVKKLNTIKKQFLSIEIVTLALLLLSLVFLRIENTFIIGTHKPLNDLFYGSPYIRIWYLLLGMIIANIFISQKDNIKSDLTVLEVIITILTLFYFFFRNSLGLNSIFYRFLDVVVCCTTLIVFSFGKGKISEFLVDNKIANAFLGGIWYVSVSLALSCKNDGGKDF